jgi:uncharacterized protein (TIGR03435 family)
MSGSGVAIDCARSRLGAVATATAATFIVLTGAGIAAQVPPPQMPLSFEVASVKPNRSGDNATFIQLLPGGRFLASNATLRALIQAAYQFELQEFQIVGGEGWMDTERFDIDARAGAERLPNELSAMVRTLLGTRFKLVTRRERREMPIFVLSVGSSAQPGPMLKPASGTCVSGPIPTGPTAPRTPVRCGIRVETRDNGTLHLTGAGATIAQLAQRLQFYVQRAVTDSSGLTVAYDFEVDFARPLPPRSSNGLSTTPASPDALPLATALAEQLGLRIDSARAQAEVLVIESADRPEAN